MEQYYKEQSEKALTDNEKLKGLLLEQLGEMATLKRENIWLREKLEGKLLSEKEQNLGSSPFTVKRKK